MDNQAFTEIARTFAGLAGACVPRRLSEAVIEAMLLHIGGVARTQRGGLIASVFESGVDLIIVPPEYKLWAAWTLTERDGFYCSAYSVTDLCGPFARARWTPFLVLDELGQEHIGENSYSISQINRLITERLADGLPTVAITQFDRDHFHKRYGGSLARLVDDKWPLDPRPKSAYDRACDPEEGE